MTLTSKPLAIIIIAVMFGGIFFSSAAGWWQTESNKEAAVYSSGAFAGQANPADIRGSYTLGDVEKNFGLPAAVVAQAFGVQAAEPAAFQVKGLETMYADSPQEVGTTSVRLFVALYQGLPIDLSADTYLPESAAALLRTRPLTAEQAAYVEAHVVPNLADAAQPSDAPAALATPAAPTAGGAAAATPAHAPRLEEGGIKGKTTFAELLAWGLQPEAIERILGVPLPSAPGMTVRDFCTQNGLSFETIRPAIQAELDKLP
jgi:hypothetical protein